MYLRRSPDGDRMRVLVNVAWHTPSGLLAVLTEHPDPDHVALALFADDTLVSATPLHATVQEAVDYCDTVFTRAQLAPVSVLLPIEDLHNLNTLRRLGEREATQAALTLTMPQRSMS